MFICFSVLLIICAIEPGRMHWAAVGLGFIGILMTCSGTGVGAMLVIALTLAAGRWWRWLLPLIVPVSYALVARVMPYLRGKDYVEQSLGTRADILNLHEMHGGLGWLFKATFGTGTTGAWLLKENFGVVTLPVMTDSLLAQLIVNLGGIALVLYLLVMIWLTLAAYARSRVEMVLWLIVTGYFSVTTPLTEAFPMNLMLVVALAYGIRTGTFSGFGEPAGVRAL